MKTKTKKAGIAVQTASALTTASTPAAPPAIEDANMSAAQSYAVTTEKLLMMPSAQNGRVLQAWAGVGAGNTDLSTIADELRKSSKALIGGDMKAVEAMLYDQAVALQAIFTTMAIEASKADHLSRLDPLLRLALKAQGQARATLETLAMIKNPPVVYARQANISNGPQQVNNGTFQTSDSAHAVKEISAPTELFQEQRHEQPMDPGATCTPCRADVRTDTHLAAVGAIDRPQDRRRKGAQQEQPLPRRTAAPAARGNAGAAVRDVRSSGGARSAVGPGSSVPSMRAQRRGTQA